MDGVASSLPLPPVLDGVAALARRYQGFIFDLWGVLHDGERAYPGAADALRRLKAAGCRLCLLSNAPRRETFIAEALAGMGIARDCYHHLVTSGEATWQALAVPPDSWHGALSGPGFVIGLPRDYHLLEDHPHISRTDRVAEARFLVATGPFTFDHDTLESYEDLLQDCVRRGLPLICANPDMEVMIGPRRVLCGGPFAKRYAELGGAVRWHGKPHGAVYEWCFRLLGVPDRGRIVALGDSLHTDIAGAAGAGIDSVLVTAGIHGEALGTRLGEIPSPQALSTLLTPSPHRPQAILPQLVW